MNKKTSGSGSKVAMFLKKNIYYILLGMSLLAVGVIITLALIFGKAPAQPIDQPNDETPVDADPVTMLMPVAGDFTIGENYKVDNVVWVSTLKRYTSHNGVDFVTEGSVDVVAVLDGTVVSVDADDLKGVEVVIDHGKGLRTVYRSLADSVTLKAGDTVKRGDVIGKTSDTMRISKNLGNHLHFEVMVNGAHADPNEYLSISDGK